MGCTMSKSYLKKKVNVTDFRTLASDLNIQILGYNFLGGGGGAGD